jgi:protein-disulfide isomerase
MVRKKKSSSAAFSFTLVKTKASKLLVSSRSTLIPFFQRVLGMVARASSEKKLSPLITLLFLTLAFSLINLYNSFLLSNKVDLVVAKIESLRSASPPSPSVLGQEIPPSQPAKVEGVSADDDPFLGSSEAPVTIVVFSDFQCPYCQSFAQESFPLIKKEYLETGKAKFVFRDFPLAFHEYAQKAAEAAECAQEQGKFWEYHDKIFENQRALEIANLKQHAQDLGLNQAAFENCLDSGQMAQEVKKDFEEGSRYGVEGTPAFFVNGTPLVGAQPFPVFQKVIEQELNDGNN